jgi:hypothetical protein
MNKRIFLFALLLLPFKANAFLTNILEGINNGISAVIHKQQGISKPGEPVAQAVKEPTRLELRQMQTRKFVKPPEQVIKAIIELNKDKGANCSGLRPPIYSCIGSRVFSSVGNKKIENCVASDGVSQGPIEKQPELNPDGSCVGMDGVTSYEFDTNYPKNTETILRIRIKGPSGMGQVTTPEKYTQLFKEIADGLFIDAIQLTPAEMQ